MKKLIRQPASEGASAWVISPFLASKCSSLKFRVPCGGPVEIESYGQGYVVTRGSMMGLNPVCDTRGFPYSRASRHRSLPFAAALDLAERVCRYLSTPPEVPEIVRWRNRFNADKHESAADRRSMTKFLNQLALVVKKELPPKECFATFQKMDTYVREAVPARFMLPLEVQDRAATMA